MPASFYVTHEVETSSQDYNVTCKRPSGTMPVDQLYAIHLVSVYDDSTAVVRSAPSGWTQCSGTAPSNDGLLTGTSERAYISGKAYQKLTAWSPVDTATEYTWTISGPSEANVSQCLILLSVRQGEQKQYDDLGFKLDKDWHYFPGCNILSPWPNVVISAAYGFYYVKNGSAWTWTNPAGYTQIMQQHWDGTDGTSAFACQAIVSWQQYASGSVSDETRIYASTANVYSAGFTSAFPTYDYPNNIYVGIAG